MLTKNSLILAKVETTYGTDATPTGTDALLVSSPSLKVDGNLLVRDYVRSTLSPIGHVVGRKNVTVTFETELKGSGAAGTAPEIDALLRGCGMHPTVVASTSVTYDPVSTGAESITMYVYFDGLMHKVVGCRGSFSFNLEAGSYGKFSWTFEGKYAKPTDTPMATPTFNATKPVPVLSAGFTVGSYGSGCINAFSFDMATTITRGGCMNSSDGYGDSMLVSRDPNGSFDPEAVLIATEDFWGDWESSADKSITCSIGTAAGNIVTINVPQAEYREVNYGDREGIRTYEIPFTATGTGAGDDEIQLVFT